MKKLLVGLLALGSISAFASSITHENCNLYLNWFDASIFAHESETIKNKGYNVYTGTKIENTLELKIDTSFVQDMSAPSCQGGEENLWGKHEVVLNVANYRNDISTVLESSTLYFEDCENINDDEKALGYLSQIIAQLPVCVVK